MRSVSNKTFTRRYSMVFFVRYLHDMFFSSSHAVWRFINFRWVAEAYQTWILTFACFVKKNEFTILLTIRKTRQLMRGLSAKLRLSFTYFTLWYSLKIVHILVVRMCRPCSISAKQMACIWYFSFVTSIPSVIEKARYLRNSSSSTDHHTWKMQTLSSLQENCKHQV